MLDCEYDNVRPDVVLLGKALSGGGQSNLSFISHRVMSILTLAVV